MEIKSNDSANDSECSELKYTDEFYDPNVTRRRNSFVWKYFRQIDYSNSFECVICNGCVGHQTSNLARHLAFSHNIKNPVDVLNTSVKRGRPSRSFIWKYCTKQDEKHACCNLCQKVLYFGSGNTENVAKHLRRKHSNLIDPEFVTQDTMSEQDLEAAQAAATISQGFSTNGNSKDISTTSVNVQKERKGGSYVWNYCDKLSRHSIRCNLCNKIMSFHGTANAITHLQRRHNIVGKFEGERTTLENTVPDLSLTLEEEQQPEVDEDGNTRQYKRKRSTASTVWKYCTRIGRDVVRCGFCKKNLSYQGTSNLQRHLHRMHGVVTQGRIFKGNESDDANWKNVNINLIWQHCSFVDGGEEKTKCNLCNALFDSKAKDEISKHLRQTHGIEPKSNMHTSTMDNGDFDDWSKNDYSNDDTVFDEGNIKKDDSVFDDIIEEDPMNSNCDEEPFDPNTFHEFPSANPLSPHSSKASSPIPDHKKMFNSKKMQQLFEEKVRMEAEYFREKAAFYRMQKYLTALQAKKIRVELEHLTNVPNGNIVAADGYNINIQEPANMNTQ